MSPDAAAYMKRVLRMVVINKMGRVHRQAARRRMMTAAAGRMR